MVEFHDKHWPRCAGKLRASLLLLLAAVTIFAISASISLLLTYLTLD